MMFTTACDNFSDLTYDRELTHIGIENTTLGRTRDNNFITEDVDPWNSKSGVEEENLGRNKRDAIIIDTDVNTSVIISEFSETDAARNHRVMIDDSPFKYLFPELPTNGMVGEPTHNRPYSQSTNENEENYFHGYMIYHSCAFVKRIPDTLPESGKRYLWTRLETLQKIIY